MSLSLDLGLGLGLPKASSASGGFTLDTGLPTPALSLAVGKTTYPPQFTASFTGGIYTGDQIEFWSAATYSALVTAMASTGTLLNDDDDNGLVDATLSGIAAGLTYAACRLRVPSLTTYGPTSNIILHGDATAPTLTSSTTSSVAELQPVLYTATFSELVNTPTLSGTDATLLAVSGSQPSTSYNVVLATGLNLDYDVATGGKTSYSFSIGADDLAGNTLAPVAITANVTDVADTPSAFTFTDVNNPTPSTLQISNTITVAGLAGGLTLTNGTLTGTGEYNKNGGGWTSTVPFSFTNGDTFQVRHTSSSDGSAVNTTLSLNGTSDTFSSQIPSLPASRVFQFDADDLTTLFKEIAGTTAVTTSGDTVGKWNDKSGNARHVTAPADDATRPLYDLTSGVHSVVGAAINSTVLIGTNPSGMWQAGAWTLVFAVKANAGTGQAVMADGSSSSNNPLAAYARSNGSTASTMSNSFRDSATGTINLTDPTVAVKTTVFDNNYRVIVLIDDGSGFTVWYDGVKQSKVTSGYNRGGGSITGLDRMSLFARVRPTIDSYFTGQIQHISGFARALSDAEAAQATTYAALKQGRSL